MAIYFYFYKLAPFEAVITVLCAAITLVTGIYFNFVKVRIARKQLRATVADSDIDPEIFVDEYLHPCYRKQKEYQEAKSKEMPLVVDLSYGDEDDEISDSHGLLSLN